MATPGYLEAHSLRMRKFTDQQLVEELAALGKKLGRTPARREAPRSGRVYRRHFGSYNQAVVEAGMTPNVQLPDIYLKKSEQRAVRLGLRFAVLRRDGFRCQYCGGTPQKGYLLQVDHVIPRSKGGKTVAQNLVTACFLCNSGKSDGALVQWEDTAAAHDPRP